MGSSLCSQDYLFIYFKPGLLHSKQVGRPGKQKQTQDRDESSPPPDPTQTSH